MAHYTDKTHIFRDENDNRMVVITSINAVGWYSADLIETTGGALELLKLEGYGDSRLSAIADLNEKIKAEGPR
jgi:hypothetical protein